MSVQKNRKKRFEKTMLPHLPEAYRLALWLMRDPHDAEDVVQEAYLKAFLAFDQFSGENSVAWLLKIVRNNSMTLLTKNSGRKVIHLDDVTPGIKTTLFENNLPPGVDGPEQSALNQEQQLEIHRAISQLPSRYREVIVLREFLDFNYNHIAMIVDVPVGTVMSRLSRARRRLFRLLASSEPGALTSEL